MKRSNKLSIVAFTFYGAAWAVSYFGYTGVSKVFVVISALVFLAAIVGFLITGLKFLFGVLNGDREIKITKPNGRWDDGDDFVDMQTGVGNDVRVSAVDGINRNY